MAHPRLANLLGGQGDADELRATGNRLLRRTAGQSRTMLILLAAVTLVQAGATVLTPGAVGRAIDAVSHPADLSGALWVLAALLGIATLATAADDLISSYYGSDLTARLRHRLIDHVLTLGLAGKRRFAAGDVLTRLTENAAGPATFLPLLISAIATLLTTVGAVVGLALIDPWLAVTFLLGVPAAIALLRLFMTTASAPMLNYQQIQADIIARLIDAHQGARTIRASGTVERDFARIVAPVGELHASGDELWQAQRKASWQLSLLAPVLQVAVLAVGGFALTNGTITAGQLVAASSYVGLALGSIGLFDTLVALLTAQVAAGRVGDVLRHEPAVAAARDPAPLPAGRGRLELRSVSVRVDDRSLLSGLDLTVEPGTSLALVGRSGAGKTVLTSLAGRQLDPDEGTVLLDGVPVSRLRLADLRSAVTYAYERPALLGRTVADMISYGQPQASRTDVERAAKTAQADRFIRLLPEGYDTPLARAPMSGGELQRLGIAQAVLSDARLIVLDDATSSLDTATEVQVSSALQHVLAGRTSIVVAQRAATAARADLVAWLDQGRIRAVGPHHQLWSDPAYRAVFGAGHAPSTEAASDAEVDATSDAEAHARSNAEALP